MASLEGVKPVFGDLSRLAAASTARQVCRLASMAQPRRLWIGVDGGGTKRWSAA